eukprot:SAG31_NODE_16932_length_690_cov_0.751269_2_plen_119_part_01
MVLDGTFKSDDGMVDDETIAEAMLPLSAMPNHISFAIRAGTACVFDNATWHASLNHTVASGDRRNVILSYGAWTLRSGMGRTTKRSFWSREAMQALPRTCCATTVDVFFFVAFGSFASV